uniref:Uncharacterized protein n=1 Tax=Arundo donax TaxID=35708 RepID=A0A0A8Y861_ARUDO
MPMHVGMVCPRLATPYKNMCGS